VRFGLAMPMLGTEATTAGRNGVVCVVAPWKAATSSPELGQRALQGAKSEGEGTGEFLTSLRTSGCHSCRPGHSRRGNRRWRGARDGGGYGGSQLGLRAEAAVLD
jgi:hypothetical protein